MMRIRRPTARTLRRLLIASVPLLVASSAAPTLGAFTGLISGTGTNVGGSLVLTTTPSGGSTCTSTGGTNTPFTSDLSSCSGSVLPASELSSSSSTSLATAFGSSGTIAPSSASLTAGPQIALDSSGNGDNAFVAGGVRFGASGPLGGSAAGFDGVSGALETQQELTDPGASGYTLSAWVKVASGYSSGGGIMEFQDKQAGTPGAHDRKLWIDNSGHICAGEYTSGSTEVATSGTHTYNDGSWHYVVASFSSSSGLTLYVDGSSVGSNSSATSPQNYPGWWIVGYNDNVGWTPAPTSTNLNGSIAEVAVFPSALTSTQVTTLYNSGSGSESSFETRVLADSPSEYWPLQGSSTTTGAGAGTEVAPDASGNGADAFPLDGVTFGASGPLSANAASFNGSNGALETEQELYDPGASGYTLAAWFKVASGYSSGGNIIEFQNQQGPGSPTLYDSKLWMDNSGHIWAGQGSGGPESAESSGAYNDGNWHYVVASFNSSTGLTLYVDGSQVGSDATITAPQNYEGWWIVGYGDNTYWPSTTTSSYLAGSLAEVAVFPSALTGTQVTTIYNSGSGSESSFETRVLADAPSQYWPLQSPSTTTNLPAVASLPELSTNNNFGTPQGGVSQVDAGPISGGGAMYFNGASNAYVETATSNAALPSSFSVAAWFRAPSGLATGGGIMSFDSAQAGGGTAHDPLVWMDDSGHVVVGTWAGSEQTVTSASAYDDGKWHFLVATVSSAGLSLYIDGSLVTTDSSGTSGGGGGGYWLIGYSDENSWPDVPTDPYWTGDIAHVAYFPAALSSTQITALYDETGTNTFEAQVLADSPTYYWPLTDSGTTESENWPFFQIVPDYSGNNDAATAVGSTVTLGAAGPYSSSFAGAFTGASGFLETSTQMSSPADFTLVGWFKAPSHSTGGVIIGFNSAQNGAGATYDRTVWMDNSGHIVAGFWNGSSSIEQASTASYDDNHWHLFVAAFTTTQVTLYVDSSTAIGTATSSVSAPVYSGYWVLGYNPLNQYAWNDVPSDEYWDGELADVAMIPATLVSSVPTLFGESTQAGFISEMRALAQKVSPNPIYYWTLGDSASAPTDAGAIELSVQAAKNGATTCLFPAGSGSCPALSESDLTPLASTWAPAAPTSAYSTTITITGQETSAAPAAFAGLHFVVPLGFSGAAGAWIASLIYASANFEL
jgi:hypothetical protein